MIWLKDVVPEVLEGPKVSGFRGKGVIKLFILYHYTKAKKFRPPNKLPLNFNCVGRPSEA